MKRSETSTHFQPLPSLLFPRLLSLSLSPSLCLTLANTRAELPLLSLDSLVVTINPELTAMKAAALLVHAIAYKDRCCSVILLLSSGRRRGWRKTMEEARRQQMMCTRSLSLSLSRLSLTLDALFLPDSLTARSPVMLATEAATSFQPNRRSGRRQQ